MWPQQQYGYGQAQPARMVIGPPPPAQRNVAPDTYYIFQQVDRNGDGRIDDNELQAALSNGTWQPFNPETVRLLIKLFDRSGTGTVDVQEFRSLWKYVSDWYTAFQRFDRDRSGNIDRVELQSALQGSGYQLSQMFYTLLIRKHDRTGSGLVNFDDFIQMCICLQTLTEAFRNKDQNRDGWIEVGYEEFLTMVLQAKI